MDAPVFGNSTQVRAVRFTRPLDQRAPSARAIYSKGRLRQTNARLGRTGRTTTSSSCSSTAQVTTILAERSRAMVCANRVAILNPRHHRTEFATEVRDLLLHPPVETPYEVLKAELTKRTSASEQRRIKELLSADELGDRTLTHAYMHEIELIY